MGLNSAALNLDLNSDFVTKPVSDFLSGLSPLDHTSNKVEKLEHYIHLLEDEMRKIQVFQRELPLSMLLLNDGMLFFLSTGTDLILCIYIYLYMR